MRLQAIEDNGMWDLFDRFSGNVTERRLKTHFSSPKAEACLSFPKTQDDNVKGKVICLDEDDRIDEGKAVTLMDPIFASDEDECNDIPEKSVDNKEEKEGTSKQLNNRRKILKITENNRKETMVHRTKSHLLNIFDCALIIVSLLTNGHHLAVKPSKMAVCLTVLLLVRLCPMSASPIQKNNETHGIYEYELLHTPICDYGGSIRSGTCETNEVLLNIYFGYCGFTDMCGPRSKPVCVYDDNGEMLHICSPKDLACPKGYWRRVSRKPTDPNVVLVREEKCSKGRYKPYVSNCYDICMAVHEDINEERNQEYNGYIQNQNGAAEINITMQMKNGTTSKDSHLQYDKHVPIVIVLVCAALIFAIASLVFVIWKIKTQ